MKSHILAIFTRTPLHVGAGASVGALDQPIQRERHTGYPIIPGSAIKGVIRNHFLHTNGSAYCDTQFGRAEKEGSQAGLLSFTEAKILLFPLRSAAGSFAMVTSCHALARFKRDSGLDFELPESPPPGTCLGGELCRIGSRIILEEYAFDCDEESILDPKLTDTICRKLISDPILEAALSRLVVLSDEDFAFFVKNATEIRNHNRIDPLTGTVDGSGFFNEEVVPPESLFIASIHPTGIPGEPDSVVQAFEKESILQFGGNSTTGLGFCTVKTQTRN